MKTLGPWVAIILMVVVVILQSMILSRLDDLKPSAPSNEEVVRIPSLKEIDQRIMHWTLHHGSHFSANHRISILESTLVERLDRLERKLDTPTAPAE